MEEHIENDLKLGLSFLTASQRTRRTRFGVTTEELLRLLLELKTQTAVVQHLGLHQSNGSVTDEIEKVSAWNVRHSRGKNVSEKLINLWYQMKSNKEKSTPHIGVSMLSSLVIDCCKNGPWSFLVVPSGSLVVPSPP